MRDIFWSAMARTLNSKKMTLATILKRKAKNEHQYRPEDNRIGYQ